MSVPTGVPPHEPTRHEQIAAEAGVDPDWLRWHIWEEVAFAELEARKAREALLREIVAAGLVETVGPRDDSW